MRIRVHVDEPGLARVARDRDEGFTLVEILIVIIVLAVLAAVVVFSLTSVTGDAKSSACQADAKQVVTAVATYNSQNSPTTITAETYSAGPPVVFGKSQQDLLVSNGYLSAWPGTNNDYSLRLANAHDVALGVAQAGDVMVVVGATTTNYKVEVAANGTASGTGCFAL